MHWMGWKGGQRRVLQAEVARKGHFEYITCKQRSEGPNGYSRKSKSFETRANSLFEE